MPEMVGLTDVGDWRFEYKYHLSLSQYYCVKAAIRPFMHADAYTKIAPNERYFVRSLYYDSLDFRSYQEKVYGNSDRTKLRIRTYSRELDESSEIRVEMKSRKGIAIEKHSTFIPISFYKTYMEEGVWPILEDKVLIEFDRYVRLKTLHPLILVQYSREGYSSNGRENLRITFDHQVESMRSKSLFSYNSVFRTHKRGVVVLEIKCNKSQPYWLRQLVKTYGLRIVPNSKFAQGIELSRPEIVMPMWSFA